jgi:hypothetical protein
MNLSYLTLGALIRELAHSLAPLKSFAYSPHFLFVPFYVVCIQIFKFNFLILSDIIRLKICSLGKEREVNNVCYLTRLLLKVLLLLVRKASEMRWVLEV